MNKIAQGMVFFTSKRVLRLLGVPKEALPPVQLPQRTKQSFKDKTAKPIALAGAAGALLYASADERFRKGVKDYAASFKRSYERLSTEAEKAARSSASGSKSHASNGSGSNGSSSSNGNGSHGHRSNGNGSNGNRLAKMTRAELYELAKKNDVPGRSSMTKDELKKALS